MVSILVQLNLNAGSVVISGTEDGELCELRLQWKSKEEVGEGFYIVENTFNSISLPQGVFITISELASEIFIRECIKGVSRVLDSTDIEYVTDNGIHLTNPVFLPPSIIHEDDIEDFIQDQTSLVDVWSEYRKDGELTIRHFDLARKEEVLYDFVSLLNFERFILIAQLENN